ncbi:translation elongation factor-like protein [candidate division WWE3 bacterium CG08_land_8_20_14_0_20_41_15]|uniref:Translation elongation factor-like protein n=1 Tax=candidate division WWE3 bacterium CG08_land_8_20_14_0_20_41_15 TaxID=1975086 RepID=A0A2H0X905_UNCKA|nr:MAG: translation elongation factor-like protein [candidate division WWE3 bacterium CG08_land_8_20_14_0_20_41_15]
MEQEEIEVGSISHFFPKIGVAVLDVTTEVKTGEKIHIVGSTTDFEQEVFSMQIDKMPIQSAKKGQSVGLKVDQLTREGDRVYKLV